MKRFELWLDESGDFDHDENKIGGNPSLIGGLLVEIGSFSDAAIQYVLPEEGTYHSVNENDQMDRFRKIEEKLFDSPDNRLVVFSNRERIMVLDNNLTYLNIISEGIHQLLEHLNALYGEVFLRLVIANRVNTTTGLDPAQSVVPRDEYEKRLREKLILISEEGLIRDDEWEIQTSSARKDKRLMLSDIVCNTFYTRNKKRKFTGEEREHIEGIYGDENKTLIFTVFQSVMERRFKNDLLENRIGEAISDICLSDDKDLLRRMFALLKANMVNQGVYDIRMQYSFIQASIEYYINIVRDFDICILYLNNLLTYYVALLRELGRAETTEAADRLELDINFYLLTVYTHTGNVKATEELEKLCREKMEQLPASLDNVNYWIKFDSRRVINLVNRFAFHSALEAVEKLIKNCKDVKELLDLFYADGNTHYEELAKAYGEKVQIETFLVREDASYGEDAVETSDLAIAEFLNESDRQRQYLYRVTLETERGKFDTALDYLKRSVGLPPEAGLKDLLKEATLNRIFVVCGFVRLMAEGSLRNWPVSEEMYSLLSKSDIVQSLEEHGKAFHPAQIIFWKYAGYCASHEMMNAAERYYKKAEEICFGTADLTMNVIGLAITMEHYSVLLRKNDKTASSLQKTIARRYNQVIDNGGSDTLEMLWGDFDIKSQNPDYFYECSRKVAY